ncbi:MAG: beta-N-acetylhexosaminidase [Bacteroidetes bacterium]|nr:MAG: beta-N-acetylhexosaminidase [Bacteroidota bacterium]
MRICVAKTCFNSMLVIILNISLMNGVFANPEKSISDIPLIPFPNSIVQTPGKFSLDENVSIVMVGENLRNEAEILNDHIHLRYGIRLRVTNAKSARNAAINLSIKKSNENNQLSAYRLISTPDRILIEAGTSTGVFHGIQTLIQLMPPGNVRILDIPCVNIEDKPRFSWRGMHLDVSRHFFPVSFIKKYIDYLALYKFNTFHWHITDDQGWRIEIKKYPKLQEISAYRKRTLKGHLGNPKQEYDEIRYGGYYTQQEIREVVEYASKRHINIVPEIEMPGHAQAALAAYPALSCTGGPFEVADKWGVFYDVFCPRNETFEFLQNVLSEVVSLFPGKYIHIGGDECPKDRWENCVHCQELIRKEGLKDENELQSYFIKRIQQFLSSKNKKLIGWDEILDGGLAPEATVMSWRGYRGGIQAAKAGHDVVMTPTSFCYFDFYQSDYPDEPLAIGAYLPVERVYGFEPVPDALSKSEAKHILGAQANVWTEYISTPEHVEYMIFPRMAALAEVVWTNAELKNYESFANRITSQFKMLDFFGINYSKAIYDIHESTYPAESRKGLHVTLRSSYPHAKIHYTLNGDVPDNTSYVFKDPIQFDQSTGIRAMLMEQGTQRGREYSKVFRINLATGKEIILGKEPHEEYSSGGGFTLINGLTGSMPWMANDWIGYRGDGLDATVDLGKEYNIKKVSLDVLREEVYGIYFPKGLRVLSSTDGVNYTSLKKLEEDEINPDKRLIEIEFPKTIARYVKVLVRNYGEIPEGRYGSGKPAWLLVSEIMVD